MLCKDKTKREFGKNTTLTPTKTLPKKQDHSPIDFQIILPTYKLDSQNKNYIYNFKKKKHKFFFFCYKIRPQKKKASSHLQSVYDEASFSHFSRVK